MWHWEGDTIGEFYAYSNEVASFLEKAHQCRATFVDLDRHPFYLPYTVHLSRMLQVRRKTNRQRRIKRVTLSQPYMPTSNNFSNSSNAVSPFTIPVFQPVSATSLQGLHGGGFPIPGTSQVDPGRGFVPLLPVSLSSGSPACFTALPAPSVGGGLHAGSSSNVVDASPFLNSCGLNDQKPLFTIGRTPPSSGAAAQRRKRVLVRDLTNAGR